MQHVLENGPSQCMVGLNGKIYVIFKDFKKYGHKWRRERRLLASMSL